MPGGVEFDIVVAALRDRATIRLEKRPKRYMFGCLNYGDVPGYMNDADRDPWDVFAPGYEGTLPFGHYTCTGVLGVLFLDNLNHKIAVTIDHPGYDALRAQLEIDRFSRRYCRLVKVPGRWIPHTVHADRRIELRPSLPKQGMGVSTEKYEARDDLEAEISPRV